MTIPLTEEQRPPRDTAYWAKQATTLKVARTPTGALDLNVEGCEVLSPLQGFSQRWQKVYQVRLNDAEVKHGVLAKILEDGPQRCIVEGP